MRFKYFIVTLSMASCALVVPTSAGALTYSSASAWTTAGPVDGTLDFSSETTGPHLSPLTVSPVIFTALLGSTLGVSGSFGPGTGNFVYTLNSMQIAPVTPGTIFGIGFNLGCYSSGCGSAQSIVVKDVNNNVFTYSSVTTPGFWGVRSDLAIASIQIIFPTNNDYAAIDDLGYGGQAQIGGGGGDPPSETPEAATLILIGTGLGLIARYRRYSCFPTAA